MRLNWDKRYITLAPVATVLGLAFKLRDPDKLLGDEEDLGITCALVPTDTCPASRFGERHDPLGVAVHERADDSGEDVFVPLDFIIGGARDGRKGLDDADAVAGGRTRHLAPVDGERAPAAGDPHGGRLRHDPQAVQHADRRFEGIEAPPRRASAA